MRHPLSASERRGIIVIALVALIVTGAGIIVPRCTRSSSRIEPADVSILIPANATGKENSDSIGKRKGKERKSRKKTSGKKTSPKNHSYRSPHDEKPL